MLIHIHIQFMNASQRKQRKGSECGSTLPKKKKETCYPEVSDY